MCYAFCRPSTSHPSLVRFYFQTFWDTELCRCVVKQYTSIHPSTPIFGRLEQEATAALTPRLQFVARAWIESATWPPTCCSLYFQSVRKNHDLEGWHTRLNARGWAGIYLYMLVTLLHDESSLIHVQLPLVSDEKLKRHQKIFGFWEKYENGDPSAHQGWGDYRTKIIDYYYLRINVIDYIVK